MSLTHCSVCGPKRLSRALCNCCHQYLCRDHLKEHDQILESQLEPLADQINQMIDHFEHFRIDELIESNRKKLDQWRQMSIESIDKMYLKKFKEIDDYYHRKWFDLKEKTKQIQKDIGKSIRDEDVNNEQIEIFFQRIKQIEEKQKFIEEKPLKITIHPIDLRPSSIEISFDDQIHNETIPWNSLSPIIERIPFPTDGNHCIASNHVWILTTDQSELYLYDHNLMLLNQTILPDRKSIQDLCWSSTLNHFLILTKEDVFILNERNMSLERIAIEAPSNGHWHHLTSSKENLYLTAYKWGTRIYRYRLGFRSIELSRSLTLPELSPKDDSIHSILHNQISCLAMIIANRLTNRKRFELRLDEDFSLIWSLEFYFPFDLTRPTYFTLINENQWLVLHSDQSKFIFLSSEESVQQTIDYPDGIPHRALQIRENLLLIVTSRSLNLHQLI